MQASSSSSSYFDKERSFNDLGLDRRLFKAVAKKGYVFPTLIQSRVIPAALQGKDILARARTGSGKTLAYVLPALQTVLALREVTPNAGSNPSHNLGSKLTQTGTDDQVLEPGISVVVLIPTRELCDQVYQQFSQMMYYCSDQVRHLVISGDVPRSVQVPRLKELPDILISTPSRLVEHLNRGVVSLKKSLRLLVVDEADLVFSYGYEDDLKAIVEQLPKLHQSMLMSATLTPEVESLKKLVLHNPVTFALEETKQGQDGKLSQYYVSCSSKDKFLLTFAFIKLKFIQGKVRMFWSLQTLSLTHSHIAPHHTTPHHITSHHITSHHITSHHTTSHHTTPHHITPHHTTSY